MDGYILLGSYQRNRKNALLLFMSFFFLHSTPPKTNEFFGDRFSVGLDFSPNLFYLGFLHASISLLVYSPKVGEKQDY